MPATAAVFVSSLAKSALLFLPALFYVNFHVVPKIFLTAMGVLQLATAVMGGILALTILKITKLYD